MMRRSTSALLALGAAAVVLLAGCERPPVEAIQRGYRGVGLEQVYNPRTVAALDASNVVPEAQPLAPEDGPKAGEIYQNVQLLGNLSVAQFTRTMVALTTWIAPTEGCAYCHNPANLADDSKYQKVVSRRMIQMTQHLNSDWKQHVVQTGVTCYTCHRGQGVPANIWFGEPAQELRADFIGDRGQQNIAGPAVTLASLPSDPFTPFLAGAEQIRVIGKHALPVDNRQSIKQTEWTYGLMVHMSNSLGVNCTYCHNTRSFASWEGPPQRVTAYYGIRMVRDLNNAYLTPLTSTFPAHRLGITGDVAKVNCATCHQGAYKPLYGASQIKDYPELAGPLPPYLKQTALTAPAEGSLGKVLFVTGKSDLTPEARAVIAAAVDSLKKNDAIKVDLSGFADKRGAADKNLELAKQRAFAVRDALAAGGIKADRINLKKPEFVIGGNEADARRVEINVAK